MTVVSNGYLVTAWVAGGTVRVAAERADGGPLTMRARLDLWRNESYQVPSYGGGPCGCGACNKSRHVRRPDEVAEAGEAIPLGGATRSHAWCHDCAVLSLATRCGGKPLELPLSAGRWLGEADVLWFHRNEPRPDVFEHGDSS